MVGSGFYLSPVHVKWVVVLAATQGRHAKARICAFGATQQVKADGQGVFTFVCPLPGWWAFSTSMAGDPLQDPEGKQKPLEIKTIFWVYMNDCPKTAPSKK